jgi:hypothetical protein
MSLVARLSVHTLVPRRIRLNMHLICILHPLLAAKHFSARESALRQRYDPIEATCRLFWINKAREH